MYLQHITKFPAFLKWYVHDVRKYLKEHGYDKFEGWGLHIYLGKFGACKTSSMVREVYNYCCRYKGLTVITNLKLQNFPEDTIIKPLNNINDIIEAPDNTIVVVDEIGTIFNSRDFMASKDSMLPKILFQHLCQCRHRHMMIYGTVQRWNFLDKQLRDISSDVCVCSGFAKHPFTRMVTNTYYEAWEYDMFYQNPLKPLVSIGHEVWIQTDFFRELYDTKEMVNTMLTETEYITDEQIAKNREFDNIGLLPPLDLKTEKKAQKKAKANT